MWWQYWACVVLQIFAILHHSSWSTGGDDDDMSPWWVQLYSDKRDLWICTIPRFYLPLVVCSCHDVNLLHQVPNVTTHALFLLSEILHAAIGRIPQKKKNSHVGAYFEFVYCIVLYGLIVDICTKIAYFFMSVFYNMTWPSQSHTCKIYCVHLVPLPSPIFS